MWLGLAAGLGAGALWGLTFIAPHLAPGFGPVAISIARFAVYGGLSLLLLAVARAPLGALLRRHGLAAFLLALASCTIYFVLMVMAVERIGAALTALIIGCLPITVPLTGAWRDGRLLRRILPALALIAAGLALIQWPALNGLAALPDPLGLLCAFGALAVWNVYALYNARYLARHPEIGARDWASLIGVMTLPSLPPLLLLLPATGEGLPPLGHAAAWTGLGVMAAATGIGSAWIATWFWNIASRRLPVALAGQLIVSETVFALLYAFLHAGRWPQPFEAAALALVLGGVTWGVRALRPSA